MLSGGELNPGLPRDRRGYSPLYYRRTYIIDSIWVEFILGKLPISFALIMMLLLVLLDYQRYTMYIITCHYVYEALEYI